MSLLLLILTLKEIIEELKLSVGPVDEGENQEDEKKHGWTSFENQGPTCGHGTRPRQKKKKEIDILLEKLVVVLILPVMFMLGECPNTNVVRLFWE